VTKETKVMSQNTWPSRYTDFASPTPPAPTRFAHTTISFGLDMAVWKGGGLRLIGLKKLRERLML
jgi:hypothetical protein